MSEKTEQPTPKRIRDARNKGNVAKSQDVNSTVLLIGIFCFIGMNWEKHLKDLAELILIPTQYIGDPHLDGYVGHVLWGVLSKTGAIIFPAIGMVALLGIIVNFSQVGLIFTTKPLEPDLNKLNPFSKLQQIFSKKNLFEFLKSTAKILFLGFLLYGLIRDSFKNLLVLPFCGISGVLEILGPLMKNFAKIVAFAYIFVSIIDYVYQKRNWTRQLMMTKDEIKREYKESEGDGQIKSKRKQIHREMIEEDAPQRTQKASVLVTNPEHMAIALLYDFDHPIFPLPLVLAKGVGKIAEDMIKIAKEEGIPIMRNVPLAHALMDTASVLEFIPKELIVPVAEVLRWVKSVKDEQSRDLLEAEMHS